MATRLLKGLRSPVRHIIRGAIREGKSRLDIFKAIEDRYGIGSTRGVLDMVRQEERRQAAVARVRTHPLRTKIDIGGLLQCNDPAQQARAYITIHWTDRNTGLSHNGGLVVNLRKQGRLSEVLNEGIREVIAYYVTKGYDPPEITSSKTSGNNYYRLEYLECV